MLTLSLKELERLRELLHGETALLEQVETAIAEKRWLDACHAEQQELLRDILGEDVQDAPGTLSKARGGKSRARRR